MARARILIEQRSTDLSELLVNDWPGRYRIVNNYVVLLTLASTYLSTLPAAFGLAALFTGDLMGRGGLGVSFESFVALAVVVVMGSVSLLLSVRIRNFIWSAYAKYATAAACERILYSVAEGKDDEEATFYVMRRLNRVCKTITRQADRVSRSVPGIKDEVDRHCRMVCLEVNKVAAALARSGITGEEEKNKLVDLCVHVSSAALSGRVLEYLPVDVLDGSGECQSDGQVSAKHSRFAELAAVVVTFMAVLAAGVSVFIVSGSEVLSSIAVVVGVGLFAVLLPRGGESMSWLERMLPVGGK